MNAIRTFLLGLIATGLMVCLAGQALATPDPPVIGSLSLFTQNISQNRVGLAAGVQLQIAMMSATGDGPFTVTATNFDCSPLCVDYDLTLRPEQNSFLFPGMYNVQTPFIGQSGRWLIEVTDQSTGLTSEKYTPNKLDKIRIVPTARNIRLSDTSGTPTVQWDPVAYDHDLNPATPDLPVPDYRVWFGTNEDGWLYRSNSVFLPSFVVPPGILVEGKAYWVRIEARTYDPEEGPIENRSDTITEFMFEVGGTRTTDACADSELTPTVEIDGIETGAYNDLFANGCTISDQIKFCKESAKQKRFDPILFYNCVNSLAQQWLTDGVLLQWESDAIMSAVVRSR